MREDIIMLRKEKDQLIMKNSYFNMNNQKDIDILRKDNNALIKEISQFKSMYKNLYDKNKKTEESLDIMKDVIFKMRRFQSQDLLASQEVETQFNRVPTDFASKRLEDFAIQNAISFLSTV
tara:strand:- start:401 stop:763 length:363 start_codon:yes stop_codon:yes gene_type:complete